MTRRAIHVVGAAATGKSSLAAAIAVALDVPHHSPDQVREVAMVRGTRWGRRNVWSRLARLVAEERLCVLESAGVLRAEEQAALRGAEVFRIRCTASRAVRAARLRARLGDGYMLAHSPDGRPRPGYVERLLAQAAPNLPRDMDWDTSADPDPSPVVHAVIAWVGGVRAGAHA